MSDEEKLVSHYRLKTLLRKDGFGAVYLGEDTRDGKAQVLRVIELDQQTLARITGRVRARSQRDHPLIEQIRQRMKRISELKHSHILPVIEFGEEHIRGNNDIIFYMVSPYEKESLLSYWSARSSAAELISLEVIADLIFQAGEALLYIHKRGLIHQYVRLSSFMLRSSTRGRRSLHLLLTDFWFADISAAILEEGQISQDLSLYLAPEQLTGRALAASDQYALALLAYELLLGYRLSQVDLSLGLYEHALRQRAISASAADLEIARRLDLVLARALAEDASARFHNIEEFVYTFRAVARGEAIDLSDEETFKLPAVGEKKEHKRGEAVVAAAVGALGAGALIEGLAENQTQGEAEDEQSLHTERHPGPHKMVLTSAGMEATELAAAGGIQEETSAFSQQTVVGNGIQSGTLVQEEETVTTVTEEQTQTQASAGIAAVAGFAAGLAAGAAIQREADTASEQTQITGSSAAAFAAGAAAQREVDLSEEQTRLHESDAAAFAAGLATSEEVQRERDISEERTAIIEGGTLAAGGAVLLAGSLLASEAAAGLAGASASDVSSTASAGASGVGEVPQIAGNGANASGTGAGLVGMGTTGAGEATQRAGSGTGTSGAGLVAGAGLAGMGVSGFSEATQGAGNGASAAGTGAGLAAGAGYAEAGKATQMVSADVSGSGETTQMAGTAASASGTGLAAGAGMAGAGAAGVGKAVGGANGANVGFLGSTQVAGAGAGMAASRAGASGGKYRRRRPLIAALLIVLCLFIVGAGVVFALLSFGNQSSATITLTLESHTIQNTYLITAVTTTTSQGQVQASFLKQSAAQSKSGQTTGYYAGAQATGFIRFYNSSTGCGCPIVIPAGTAFTSANGVTVVTATAASVASLCTVTVRAYAATTGPVGDIPANSVHASYGAHITVSNPYAFSGGQLGQSNALVQQSDINKLASSLQAQTTQSAQAGLLSQMKGGQRLAGTPTCQSKTTSDHAPGDFATSVTVTVTTTCSDEAYDYSGAAQIVQQQVQTQAATYFSSQYVLVGALQTTVTNATLIDAKAGTLLLAIKALGKWGYHFSNSLKQSLSTVIAGKDVNKVQALLSSQNGVSGVKINISGSDQSKLPDDSSKITIVLKE